MILGQLKQLLENLADRWVDRRPLPAESAIDWNHIQLVGHRGAYGIGQEENTVASLMACEAAGVWGIEFDLRWTKDLVPVILHDPDTGRTFGQPAVRPSQVQANELRALAPEVPHLGDLVSLLHHKIHLMIEVKEPLAGEREVILATILKNFTPGEDFHLLTLNPAYLQNLRVFPRSCLVLVTEFNARSGSQYVLREKWGGIAGHYLFLTGDMLARHAEAGQKVGVGFVATPENMKRQLLRGIDWIFSNCPLDLQGDIRGHLDDHNGAR